MSEPQCYYGCQEPEDRPDELWQCGTCHEWYCYDHWHETDLGYCIECVACERIRKEAEEDKMDEEKTYTVTFKGCTVEVCGVYAETPEEAEKIASDDLDLLEGQSPFITIWTETYTVEEE